MMPPSSEIPSVSSRMSVTISTMTGSEREPESVPLNSTTDTPPGEHVAGQLKLKIREIFSSSYKSIRGRQCEYEEKTRIPQEESEMFLPFKSCDDTRWDI